MKTALLSLRKGCSVNATLSPSTREHMIPRRKAQKKQPICDPLLTEPVVFMGSFLDLR